MGNSVPQPFERSPVDEDLSLTYISESGGAHRVKSDADTIDGDLLINSMESNLTLNIYLLSDFRVLQTAGCVYCTFENEALITLYQLDASTSFTYVN